MIALMRSGGMMAHWREAMSKSLQCQEVNYQDGLLIIVGGRRSNQDKHLASTTILHWSSRGYSG